MSSIQSIELKIQLLEPTAKLPSKANPSDACFDLRASHKARIAPGETGLVRLGWAMELEQGWEARIRGRSGLACKGIIAHPGTIDHLYRKEVQVIIHNFGSEEFRVEVGDRIAQMNCAPVYPTTLVEATVQETQRGGFGSTGIR